MRKALDNFIDTSIFLLAGGCVIAMETYDSLKEQYCILVGRKEKEDKKYSNSHPRDNSIIKKVSHKYKA